MAAEWICDGCGRRAPGVPNSMGDWRKPRDWFERTRYERADGTEPRFGDRDPGEFKGILTACSRPCIDKVAQKTGGHSVVISL